MTYRRKKVLKGTRRDPRRWFAIKAISPKTGAPITWNGKGFSTDGNAKLFGSKVQAKAKINFLLAKFEAARGLGMSIVPMGRKVRNPSGYARARAELLARMDRAAEAYENFTGHPATHQTRFKNPPIRAGFELGSVVAVEYRPRNAREGDDPKTVYRHDFKKDSQPLLIAKDDGSQLGIVGGRIRVTERGIEDL